MTPDIIVTVRFFLPEEGGRKTPIRGEFYSCPLFLGKEGFDCRLILNNRWIYLGISYEIPLKFLCWENVSKKIKYGDEFYLREGRDVAKGNIIKIINALPTFFFFAFIERFYNFFQFGYGLCRTY